MLLLRWLLQRSYSWVVSVDEISIIHLIYTQCSWWGGVYARITVPVCQLNHLLALCICLYIQWRLGVMVIVLVSIKKVAQHWARLLLGWVTVCRHLNISVCYQPPTSTQPFTPPMKVNRVPACLSGVKVECVHLRQWQITHKVNEGNKARLYILRNKIFSSANIGKLSNVSVSLY